MKKLALAAICGAAMLFTSCSLTTPFAATSNTVGKKCGESSYTLICGLGNGDAGIEATAKKAGITKISHVDQNVKNYFIFQTVTTRVYGE